MRRELKTPSGLDLPVAKFEAIGEYEKRAVVFRFLNIALDEAKNPELIDVTFSGQRVICNIKQTKKQDLIFVVKDRDENKARVRIINSVMTITLPPKIKVLFGIN